MITKDNNKKLKRYFKLLFFIFSSVRTFTVVKIKKGFNNSIGWSLKKWRSNHLLAPLTSTPTKGTKNKQTKDTKNKGIIILFNSEVSITEIIIIIPKEKIVKTKCFEKKK